MSEMARPEFTVTRAEVSDVPALHRHGRAFYSDAQLSRLAPWDAESFDRTLAAAMQGEVDGGVYVVRSADYAVRGMAAMVLFPLYFNSSVRVAQELFIYVEPEWRFGAGAALLDRLEHDAQAAGARCLIAGALSGLRDAALARVYTRRGYLAMESSFVKVLGADAAPQALESSL